MANNLSWKKVLTIKDSEGNVLEIEVFSDALVFNELESGRTYSLNENETKMLIEHITNG
jgi:hypothetical protein